MSSSRSRPVLPFDVKRIVLVGLSGSGKSSVAQALAQRIGWQVADSDDWIVARTGRTIASVFEHDGEAAFRAIEHQALADLCRIPCLVLATGGGVVTVKSNWPLMRAGSRVVWLRASEKAIVDRVLSQRQDKNAPVRPLLAGDVTARIQQLARDRYALYAQSDITVDTDGSAVDEVVAAVLTAVVASGAQLNLNTRENHP